MNFLISFLFQIQKSSCQGCGLEAQKSWVSYRYRAGCCSVRLCRFYSFLYREIVVVDEIPLWSLWQNIQFFVLGWVHHIPDTYHIPDNFDQPFYNHTWMFYGLLFIWEKWRIKLLSNKTFYYLEWRTTGPISTKLGTKHHWVKGIQVCSNEEPLNSHKVNEFFLLLINILIIICVYRFSRSFLRWALWLMGLLSIYTWPKEIKLRQQNMNWNS